MEPQKIKDTIESATKWLHDQRHEDGGWGERFGQNSNDLNTAKPV